ncbi:MULTISPECIES: hypothetical protein [Leptospira]|uniref:Uncharacterized protein n=4 Tax=Leptospira interrogans TaxID=173 RepID=M6ZI89_LEPIR|nr:MULTISPECIES: hypothetical protein [Leptospira]EMF70954.1 hypothetical protein LEP1GSC148_3941 [Leptospira interrogans serovar Canicola str. LT1962]EMN28614.1 hypothetical protein LEP1GSC083_2685 [Leptospira interrogans serovar Pyrogenes str. L0374]EMN72226.1 hypothetical protein LEP1GSC100_1993 [Leptospira interrogans serovar Bataviae str. UI 08561]EMP06193.1 hypothetical protein LEP1GSC124_1211 [Leptospira interrogans serovar Pyrogenes str. 200701872]AJR13378.1 hypothetical protein LIL_10
MKPYTKNGLRKIFSILSTVILSIFILIHCKKDSDNNTNLLLATMLIDRNKAEFKLSSVSALWPLHESQTQDNLEFNPLGLAFWSI